MKESLELIKVISNKLDLDLDLDGIESVDNTKDFPSAISAAMEIEGIEKDWSYEHKGNERAFGQKIIGEKIGLWSVPKVTAEVLELLVVGTRSKKILEIGSSAGYSGLYLAMGAKYTGGQVTTIESLDVKAEMARKNFANSGLGNVRLVESSADVALTPEVVSGVDLIFLDADKESYGRYFDKVIPYLKEDGLIIADNVFDYGHMMTDYLAKVMGTKLPGSASDSRVLSYTLPIDNGLVITKKIKH